MNKGSSNGVVLVSGGGRGLGLGIVGHYLANGHKVASFSRSTTQSIVELQKKYREKFHFAELDLTDAAACEKYTSTVSREFGPVEVLINNAGIAITGVMPLFSDEDVDKILDLNLKGTMRLTRLASRIMLTTGFGRIVNISSIVGLSGYRGLSVYGASKAALDGYTRALARELGSRNITVNSIAPGFLRTEMSHELGDRQMKQIARRTPAGRLGVVQDLLGMITLLTSREASFITGQVIVIDGGLTC
jgi:3-oxoacyl-[acyl-carrier protein] reductase